MFVGCEGLGNRGLVGCVSTHIGIRSPQTPLVSKARCSGNSFSMMSGEAPHDRASHFRQTRDCELERILEYAGPVSVTMRCPEESWLAWPFLVEDFYPLLALRLSLASVFPSSCSVPPCTLHPSSPMLALASSFSSSGMFRRLVVKYTASER